MSTPLTRGGQYVAYGDTVKGRSGRSGERQTPSKAKALGAVKHLGRLASLGAVLHVFLCFPGNQASSLSPSLSSLEQNER